MAKVVAGRPRCPEAPRRLSAWLSSRCSASSVLVEEGVYTVAFLLSTPVKDLQRLMTHNLRNWGFVREKYSRESFVALSEEQYIEGFGRCSHPELLLPASEWTADGLKAFLACREDCPGPLRRTIAFQRCGELASFPLHMELASQGFPQDSRVFAVPYIDAMSHPSLRQAVRDSGWEIADHLFEYTDSDASAGYQTPDSDEENPFPQKKLLGRIRPVKRRLRERA